MTFATQATAAVVSNPLQGDTTLLLQSPHNSHAQANNGNLSTPPPTSPLTPPLLSSPEFSHGLAAKRKLLHQLCFSDAGDVTCLNLSILAMKSSTWSVPFSPAVPLVVLSWSSQPAEMCSRCCSSRCCCRSTCFASCTTCHTLHHCWCPAD